MPLHNPLSGILVGIRSWTSCFALFRTWLSLLRTWFYLRTWFFLLSTWFIPPQNFIIIFFSSELDVPLSELDFPSLELNFPSLELDFFFPSSKLDFSLLRTSFSQSSGIWSEAYIGSYDYQSSLFSDILMEMVLPILLCFPLLFKIPTYIFLCLPLLHLPNFFPHKAYVYPINMKKKHIFCFSSSCLEGYMMQLQPHSISFYSWWNLSLWHQVF